MSTTTIVIQPTIVSVEVANMLDLKKRAFEARTFWVLLKEEHYEKFGTSDRCGESLAHWTLVFFAQEQFLEASKRYDSVFAEYVAQRRANK